MELAEALRIVGALADGRDPLTDQPLPADHLCQMPPVVRALCLVVHELQAPGMLGGPAAAISSPPACPSAEQSPPLPGVPAEAELENAGKPWLAAEETELARAFDAGATLDQLARKHGRTQKAIHGRLYRLGKMLPWPWGEPESNDADSHG